MAAVAEQRPRVRCGLGPEHADLPGEPQGILHLVGEWHTHLSVFSAAPNRGTAVMDKYICSLEWCGETCRVQASILWLDKLSFSLVLLAFLASRGPWKYIARLFWWVCWGGLSLWYEQSHCLIWMPTRLNASVFISQNSFSARLTFM